MRLILFVLAALVMAACSSTAAADDPMLENRTFISEAVDGEQIPGGGPLTVSFTDGQISAHAGCNRGSGAADLSDGHLAVTQLATTQMGCPPPIGDADGWMARFLQARPAWTLNGDTLTLTTGAATVTLRDKKVVNPDRPLTGTTWQVTSLVSQDAVSASVALEQARPTLTINADGTAGGSTGCNQFSGPAEVSGTTVTFGPLAVTRRACIGDADEIERSILRVLDGPVQTGVDADQLRLTRDDGYGLVLRAQ